jgi:hypothetical protein
MKRLKNKIRFLDRNKNGAKQQRLDSAARSSRSSFSSATSSQVSDGSIDGNLTALEDLIADHLNFLNTRVFAKLKRGLMQGDLYQMKLDNFHGAVTSHKQCITERSREYSSLASRALYLLLIPLWKTEGRDDELVLLYHDFRDMFTGLETELKNCSFTPPEELPNNAAWGIFPDLCERLDDLRKRFADCMVIPSEQTEATLGSRAHSPDSLSLQDGIAPK